MSKVISTEPLNGCPGCGKSIPEDASEQVEQPGKAFGWLKLRSQRISGSKTGRSALTVAAIFLPGIASGLFGTLLITSCSKSAPAEKPEDKTPTISVPKKISPEPAAEFSEAFSDDRSELFGREDSDSLAEEKKDQERADWERRREVWGSMSEEERDAAREEGHRRMMAELDKNGDGLLGKHELPKGIWEFMKNADKDGDDQITESERIEFEVESIKSRARRESERAVRELSGEESDWPF